MFKIEIRMTKLDGLWLLVVGGPIFCEDAIAGNRSFIPNADSPPPYLHRIRLDICFATRSPGAVRRLKIASDLSRTDKGFERGIVARLQD